MFSWLDNTDKLTTAVIGVVTSQSHYYGFRGLVDIEIKTKEVSRWSYNFPIWFEENEIEFVQLTIYISAGSVRRVRFALRQTPGFKLWVLPTVLSMATRWDLQHCPCCHHHIIATIITLLPPLSHCCHHRIVATIITLSTFIAHLIVWQSSNVISPGSKTMEKSGKKRSPHLCKLRL